MELDQRQQLALLHHVKKYGKIIPALLNRTLQTQFDIEQLQAALIQACNPKKRAASAIRDPALIRDARGNNGSRRSATCYVKQTIGDVISMNRLEEEVLASYNQLCNSQPAQEYELKIQGLKSVYFDTIPARPITFGKSSSCDIVLDGIAAPIQCQLVKLDNSYYIVNTGLENSAKVNQNSQTQSAVDVFVAVNGLRLKNMQRVVLTEKTVLRVSGEFFEITLKSQ